MSWIPPHYDVVKRRVRTINEEPSLVKQEYKDICDINQLIKKYVVTGELPQLTGDPLYGDFSNAPDYLEAQNVLMRAQEQFEGLPAKVRNRFDNDPAEFLRYLETADESKRKELLDLELIDKDFRTGLDIQSGKFHSSDDVDDNKEHSEVIE